MKLKLSDILPNPYRDFKVNPLISEKIDSLEASINQTGFWDNVVVRINAQGKPELAYGHHRLAAAIKTGIGHADFIVKKLDDAQMIQIMDNENRETYGATLHTLIESVRAVVQALAKGKIPDFEIDAKVQKSNIRYAPSFVPGVCSGSGPEHPYTAFSIAEFLGRKESGGDSKADKTILAALNALHLKEIGRFSDSLYFTKDKTGEKKPATIKEFVKITNDIKRDVERTDKVHKTVRDAENKAIEEQRKIEADAKAREKKIEEEKQEALAKEAQARVEDNKREVARQKQRQKDLDERKEEKAVIDKVKIAAIETKVENIKKKIEEEQKTNAYSLVKREVDCFLGELDTLQARLADKVKSLIKKNPNLKDRQRVWEALTGVSEWSGGWAAAQFVGSGAPVSLLKRKKQNEKSPRSK